MAVLAVSVLITVFLTIVNLVKYQTADQQERPQIKKNIKDILNPLREIRRPSSMSRQAKFTGVSVDSLIKTMSRW